MATKSKNINMCNDILFKEFFKSIEARGIVSRFLSAITGMKREIFINALYITEELRTNDIKEKRKTTDVIVRIDNNNKVIVEMNQNNYKDAFLINTSYAMNIISNMTKRGEDYSNKKVILINIDNYNHFNTDKPLLHFKIRDEEDHIENEMYNSIHLILANTKNSKYNVDTEIAKFSNLLLENSLDEMKTKNKGDKDYMAGIVKLEDLTKDIDKVGLLYDVEEAHELQLEGTRKLAIEETKKENALNFYENGVSKELICKSLKITEEELEDYLTNPIDREELAKQREKNLEKSLKYAYKKGMEKKDKENALSLYKNGASIELICKSLNITEEQLKEYIKQ